MSALRLIVQVLVTACGVFTVVMGASQATMHEPLARFFRRLFEKKGPGIMAVVGVPVAVVLVAAGLLKFHWWPLFLVLGVLVGLGTLLLVAVRRFGAMMIAVVCPETFTPGIRALWIGGGCIRIAIGVLLVYLAWSSSWP
jgi:hypothetical protein